MSHDTQAAAELLPRTRRRCFRSLAAGCLIAVLALGAYQPAANHLVSRYDLHVARDPASGILLGAEPLWLGPEDAPDAVLMVHGFLGGSNNFGDLPQILAEKGYRVRVMLLPGHGTSPRDFERETADSLLAAVRAELAALKTQHRQVFLVGHSMGGALSTLAAAEDGANGLVLGAPYFSVTHQWFYGPSAEWWSATTRPILRWVYKDRALLQVNRPGVRDQIACYDWVPLRGAETLAELGQRAQDPTVLSRVRLPVLFIHGVADGAASPEAARTAVAEMASADKTSVWLADSNHHVFWDWEREKVAAEVVAFLSRLQTQ